MHVKRLSSRMLDQSFLRFSLVERSAKNDMRTSVRVLCISTRRFAAPALSETSVSLSLHNSSTVAFSFSRYAFLRSRVFRACSRLRSRLAWALSSCPSSVPDTLALLGGGVFFFDLFGASASVSLADTMPALAFFDRLLVSIPSFLVAGGLVILADLDFFVGGCPVARAPVGAIGKGGLPCEAAFAEVAFRLR